MIDLDIEELEYNTGEHAYNANWRNEALFIYENGGNGLCVNADENGIGCAVGGAKGNSLKATSIRTLKGFAQKDFAGIVAERGHNPGEILLDPHAQGLRA